MTGEHTVRVSDVPLQATEHDIRDFFSFSGEIVHVELQRDEDYSQVAYVTLKNADARDTALLLSGAKIGGHSVKIIPMEGYVLPTSREDDDDIAEGEAYNPPPPATTATAALTEVLSRGMVIGRSAAIQVKQFDEKHGLSATAFATAVTVDQKLGLTDRFSAGTSAINQQLKGIDDKYQVSGKTESVMKHKYFLTGSSWVANAFNKAAKSAGDAAQKARERAWGGGTNPNYAGEHYYGRDGYAISLNASETSHDEYETHHYPSYTDSRDEYETHHYSSYAGDSDEE